MEQAFVLLFTIIAWLCFRGGIFFFEKTYQRWIRIFEAGKNSKTLARVWLYVVFLAFTLVAVVFFTAFSVFEQAIALGNGWMVAVVCSLIWFYAADASLNWFKKERSKVKASKESVR